MFKRPPDFIIGNPQAPYMRRWWVIPRNRLFNIYLHNILRSDEDRALHDHPWWSCSIILSGGYIEHTPRGAFLRKPGMIRCRRASASHRLELIRDKDFRIIDGFVNSLRPAWTIFITGPRVREWGFHCPQGWRHWREFIGVKEGEQRGDEIGPGCD